jgi:hypothetical protein
MKERFPGAWGNPTSSVMRTLAQNDVRGCGEFYQKASVKDREEFAVACTRSPTGEVGWFLYLVWPATGGVDGPDPTAVWEMGGPPHPDPR